MSRTDADGSGRDFDTDLSLLDDDDSGWGNLGLWPSDAAALPTYADACRALARRVGDAAALAPGESVLELACGSGVSLAFWQRVFGVTAAGIDCRLPERAAGLAAYRGRMDRLPLPAALAGRRFDAVLCIDAAYHADSLADFSACAAGALRTNGRLAFTTLLRGPRWREGSLAARGLQVALARANIPAASVLAEDEARAVLAGAGYAQVTLLHLDDAVLAGFADYVDRRAARLPLSRRLSSGWLKIRATAALCRHAHRQGLLHYALVAAHRS